MQKNPPCWQVSSELDSACSKGWGQQASVSSIRANQQPHIPDTPTLVNFLHFHEQTCSVLPLCTCCYLCRTPSPEPNYAVLQGTIAPSKAFLQLTAPCTSPYLNPKSAPDGWWFSPRVTRGRDLGPAPSLVNQDSGVEPRNMHFN